ncbi:MAG TPA: hypothetical protein VI792_04115, partial [Candidatus Eisenbacteria bacterium]
MSEPTAPRHPRAFRLYYAAVLGATLALFVATAREMPSASPAVLIAALALMVVSESSPVNLPGGGYSTVTAVIDLACLIVLGPVATASLDVVSTLVIQGLILRKPAVRMVHNMGI